MTPTHPRAVDALKPCPFCGGPARDDIYIRDGRKVECMSCSASTIAFSPDANTKAIAAWNQRPQPDHGSLADDFKILRAGFHGFDHSVNYQPGLDAIDRIEAAIAQPGDGGGD